MTQTETSPLSASSGIEKYKVSSVYKRSTRGTYFFIVYLTFENGQKKEMTSGGYRTKREANDAREDTICRLRTNTFAYKDKTLVKKFVEMWLVHKIRDGNHAASTYSAYKNVTAKYINPVFGERDIRSIGKAEIVSFLRQTYLEQSESMFENIKTVLKSVFACAAAEHYIDIDPMQFISAKDYTSARERQKKKKERSVIHIDTAETLSEEQAVLLLNKARGTSIYLSIAFALLTGIRKSEAKGIKYSDISQDSMTIRLHQQMGYYFADDASDEIRYGKLVAPKTSSSVREIQVPELLMRAIQEEHQRYLQNKAKHGNLFHDDGFILCDEYGRPRSNGFEYAQYKRLLQECGLPNIRWHALRHTYATLLKGRQISLRAISSQMGHASQRIDTEIYIDFEALVKRDVAGAMQPVIDRLMLEQENEEDADAQTGAALQIPDRYLRYIQEKPALDNVITLPDISQKFKDALT